MNPISNFSLSFSKNHFQINFFANENTPVFTVNDSYETQKYANALVAIMLDYYPCFERGLYLHGTDFGTIMSENLDNKNVGYAFGWKASELLKLSNAEDGRLSYVMLDGELKVSARLGNVDFIEPNNIYRIAFNGFDFWAKEIPWRAFDEDEGNYARHNRNALQAIKHLELLQRAFNEGKNILCKYWDDDAALYEGEKGLQAKYLLWKAGNVDAVRALVNEGIQKKNAYITQLKYVRATERLEEDPNDKTAAFTKARMEKANEESENMHDFEGNVVHLKDLSGKVVQLAAGQNILTQQYDCSDEVTMHKVAAQLRKGLLCVFVPESEVQPTAKKSARGRNVPQKVA